MNPMSYFFSLLLKDIELWCLAEQMYWSETCLFLSFPEASVTLMYQVLRERQFMAVCLVLFSLSPTFFPLAQDLAGDTRKKGEDGGGEE